MHGRAACYEALRAYCETVPLVDCHDHSGTCGPKYEDPIQVVIAGYFHSDILWVNWLYISVQESNCNRN